MIGFQKSIIVNGDLRTVDQDSDFIINRSLRFGDGLIETLRLHNGELLFFYDHMERLNHAMSVLGYPISNSLSATSVFENVSKLLEVSDISHNARIRIQVWRLNSKVYSPAESQVGFMIEAEPLTTGYTLDNGLQIGISKKTKKSIDVTSNIKSASALQYIVAAAEAQSAGFDSVVVLNSQGRVADLPGFNIFGVEKDRIITPALDEGPVAGVMRFNLISLIQSHGIPCDEVGISIEDLIGCEEVFITNVIKGIQPVASFSGKKFDRKITARIFQMLIKHLDNFSK